MRPWEEGFGGPFLNGSSSNHQAPRSGTGSASVYDLGEARRLQINREKINNDPTSSPNGIPTKDGPVGREGIGAQFPQLTYPFSERDNGDDIDINRPPRYRETLPDSDLTDDRVPEKTDLTDGEKTVSLARSLRTALNEYGVQPQFLPTDTFHRILTRSVVRRELERARFGENDVKVLTEKVYQASMTEPGNQNSATHGRKLFALLSLLNKVSCIKEFLAAGIHDNDLPFIKEESKSPNPGPYYVVFSNKSSAADENRTPITCFFTWAEHEIDIFVKYQWQLLAPYFELGNPKLWQIPDNIILPFIEDYSESSTETGGFSTVWKVKIHRAHHNAGPQIVCLPKPS